MALIAAQNHGSLTIGPAWTPSFPQEWGGEGLFCTPKGQAKGLGGALTNPRPPSASFTVSDLSHCPTLFIDYGRNLRQVRCVSRSNRHSSQGMVFSTYLHVQYTVFDTLVELGPEYHSRRDEHKTSQGNEV